MVLKVEVVAVGIDKQNPTRFDIYVNGVNGAFCGYCFSIEQANSWAEGIQAALNEQYKIAKNGFDK